MSLTAGRQTYNILSIHIKQKSELKGERRVKMTSWRPTAAMKVARFFAAEIPYPFPSREKRRCDQLAENFQSHSLLPLSSTSFRRSSGGATSNQSDAHQWKGSKRAVENPTRSDKSTKWLPMKKRNVSATAHQHTHVYICILNLQRAAPYIQFYIQQNGERHKRENEDERFYLKKEKNKEERKKSEEKRIR